MCTRSVVHNQSCDFQQWRSLKWILIIICKVLVLMMRMAAVLFISSLKLAFLFLVCYGQASQVQLRIGEQQIENLESIYPAPEHPNSIFGIWSRLSPLQQEFSLSNYQNHLSRQFLFSIHPINLESSSLFLFLVEFNFQDSQILHLVQYNLSGTVGTITFPIENPLYYEGFWTFSYALVIASTSSITFGWIVQDSVFEQSLYMENTLDLKSRLQAKAGGLFWNPLIDQRIAQFQGDLVSILSEPLEENALHLHRQFDEQMKFPSLNFDFCFNTLFNENQRLEEYQVYNLEMRLESNYQLDYWGKASVGYRSLGMVAIHSQILKYWKINDGILLRIRYQQEPTSVDAIILLDFFSYSFPFIQQNFNAASFKSEEILVDSKLLQQWHYFRYHYDFADRSITVLVSMYQNQQTTVLTRHYAEVHQFSQSLIFITVGEPNESFQIFGVELFNCFQALDYQKCAFNCKTCFGPYRNNCLTCFDDRYEYNAKLHICQCRAGYGENDSGCWLLQENMTSSAELIQDSLEVIQDEIICLFGYFLYENICYQCPSTNKAGVTCTECLINWRKWIFNPRCLTDYYLDDVNEKKMTVENSLPILYFFIDEELFFIPYGDSICPDVFSICPETSLKHLGRISRLSCSAIGTFSERLKLCVSSKIISTIQWYPDQFCNFKNCNKFCQCCSKNGCLSCKGQTYFLALDKLNCLECLIPYCKICFEFNPENLEQNSLKLGPQVSESRAFDTVIGCALCYENYQFNFQTFSCEWFPPPTQLCLKSYIGSQGNQKCYSSVMIEEDKPQLEECAQLIINCRVCVFTALLQPICVKCADGFYENAGSGVCKRCQDPYATACRLNNHDQWKLQIFGFYSSFIGLQSSNTLIFETDFSTSTKCKVGYTFFLPYQLCQQESYCMLEGSSFHYCTQDHLKFRYDPIQVCQRNCDFCIENNEPQATNPYYNFEYYQQQRCLKSSDGSRIRNLSGAVQRCQVPVADELMSKVKCINQIYAYTTASYFILYRPFFYYVALNDIDPQIINLEIEAVSALLDSGFDCTYIESQFIQNLEAVSLTYRCAESELRLRKGVFRHINRIKMSDCILELTYPDSVQIQSVKPVDISLFNITVMGSIKEHYAVSSQEVKSLHFEGLTFLNLKISDSTLFDYSVSKINQQESSITFANIRFINCEFYNTWIFHRAQRQPAVQKILIQNIVFINCTLKNSTFFDDRFLAALQDINIENISFLKSTSVLSNFFILGQNSSIKNLIISDSFFEATQLLLIRNALHIRILGLKAERSHFKAKCQILNIQSSDYLIDLRSIQVKEIRYDGSELIRIVGVRLILLEDFIITSPIIENLIQIEQYCLFQLEGAEIKIQRGQLLSSLKEDVAVSLFDFCMPQVKELLISDIEVKSYLSHQWLPLNESCIEGNSRGLLNIVSYEAITIKNIRFLHTVLIGQSWIWIENYKKQASRHQRLTIEDVVIAESSLYKVSTIKIPNFIYILSDVQLDIQLLNISVYATQKVYYNLDILDSSLSFIQIEAFQAQVIIKGLNLTSNLFFNDHKGVLSVIAESISITELLIKDINQFNQTSSHLENQFRIYTSGLIRLKAQSILIKDIKVAEAAIYDSGIFHLTSYLVGVIKISEVVLDRISCLNSACQALGFHVDSSSASLFFSLKTVMARGTTSVYGSLINIIGSQSKNRVAVGNIIMEDCLTLAKQVLSFVSDFQAVDSKVSVKQGFIRQKSRSILMKQLSQIIILTKQQFFKESNEAMINLKNCEVELNQIYLEGFLFQPFVDILFANKIVVNSIFASNLQVYSSYFAQIRGKSQESQALLSHIKLLTIKLANNMSQSCGLKIEKIEHNLADCQNKTYAVFQDSLMESMDLTALIACALKFGANLGNSFFEISSVRFLHFNQFKLHQIDCDHCQNGLISIQNNSKLRLQIFQILNSHCGALGCIYYQGNEQIDQVIKYGQFVNNTSNQGGGAFINGSIVHLHSILFLQNHATQGGGLFVEGKQSVTFHDTIFENNHAIQSGGIENVHSLLDKPQLLQIQLFKNIATLAVSQVNQMPVRLRLSYNKVQIASFLQNQSGYIIEQLINMNQVLQLPSGQPIGKYRRFNDGLGIELLLIAVSNLDEQIIDMANTTCSLSTRVNRSFNLTQTENFRAGNFITQTIAFDNALKAYTFADSIINFEPYVKGDHLEVEVKCSSLYDDKYRFRFLVQTLKCTPGEYYTNQNCLVCLENQYSVQFDATECIKANPIYIKNFTRSAIELNQGYWRASWTSSEIEICYRDTSNCLGGWQTGDNSCQYGHLGALCEECDIYNTRGQGKFQKDTQTYCLLCGEMRFQLLYIVLSMGWIVLSTLMAVQSHINQLAALKRLKLFTKLYHILARYSKVDISDYPIIYIRIIFMIAQLFILMIFTNLMQCLINKIQQSQIQISSIITSILYLFLVVQPGLILELGSLVSKRTIGGVDWIQNNVSYKFNHKHFIWLQILIVPLLVIICVMIPVLLLLILRVTKSKRDFSNLNFLHNEYKNQHYYWEEVKMFQRELILLAMTLYYEHVLLKGLLISIIVWLYILLIIFYSPYDLKQINNFEIENMILCGLIIFLGLLLYTIQIEGVIHMQGIVEVLLYLLIVKFLFFNFTNLLQSYLKKFQYQIDKFKMFTKRKLPSLARKFPKFFITYQHKEQLLRKKFKNLKSIIQSVRNSQHLSSTVPQLKFLSIIKELEKNSSAGHQNLNTSTNQNDPLT